MSEFDDNVSESTLKTKILFAQIAIPLVILSILLYLSLDLFQKDKIAYIFDTSGTTANSIAAQITTQLSVAKEQGLIVLDRYLQKSSTQTAKPESFLAGFNNIEGVGVYVPNHTPYFIERTRGKYETSVSQSQKIQQWLLLKPNSSAPFVMDFNESNDSLIFGFENHQTKLILFLKPSLLLSSIRRPGPFAIGLINSTHQLVARTESLPASVLTAIPFAYHDQSITKAVRNKSGEDYLVAYSPLEGFPFTVGVAIKKKDALKVVGALFKELILAFLVLISISIIFGVLITEEITQPLARILEATQQITEGFFDIKIKIRKRDEVGAIARSINIMAIEIKRLLIETEKKTKMEAELKVAQLLQSTFFPKPFFDYHSCTVLGRFEPATECCGDWWFHFSHNNKIYFLIGDATGHGVPAALLTSTVCSALKIITSKASDICEMMNSLNRTVYEIYEAKISMTFLMSEFDPGTNKLSFINASHMAPIVLRYKAAPLTRKDLEFLDENPMPSVGVEQDYQYQASHIQLYKGDRIFFYTDGIMDLQDKHKKSLNERDFHKFLIDSHSKNTTLADFDKQFYESIKDFQYQELIDDLTFLTLQV